MLKIIFGCAQLITNKAQKQKNDEYKYIPSANKKNMHYIVQFDYKLYLYV